MIVAFTTEPEAKQLAENDNTIEIIIDYKDSLKLVHKGQTRLYILCIDHLDGTKSVPDGLKVIRHCFR